MEGTVLPFTDREPPCSDMPKPESKNTRIHRVRHLSSWICIVILNIKIRILSKPRQYCFASPGAKFNAKHIKHISALLTNIEPLHPSEQPFTFTQAVNIFK